MTNNLDTQYINLLKDVLANGTKKADRTGVGTISKFGHTMRFNMAEGFPLLTTKKIFTKAMFHELLWFIQGGDNIKYLVDNDVRIWNEWPHKKYNETNPQKQMDMAEFVKNIKENREFAETWGDLGPVYGKQWVDWKSTDGTSVNQLDQLIDALRNNPDSRRIMVSAWNPGDLPKQLLPPCHYAWQVWSRELSAPEREDHYAKINGLTEEERREMNPNATDDDVHVIMDEMGIPKRALSLMFQMRSVDLGLGWPFDVGSYAALLHMIAQCVNMIPEELIINSGDTHIYTNQVAALKSQLDREPYKLPTLWLNPEITNIFDFKFEDIEVIDYQCHPAIKMDVAI